MTVTTQISQAVDHPIRYAISADHEHREHAQAVAETTLDTLIDSIHSQPRSLQKRIGPSEIGKDCKRALLRKLNNDPEPKRPEPPWKPTIGTALHSHLQDVFEKASAPGGREEGRWMCEETVEVGKIGDQIITGSTDLYDAWGHAVIDWKCVGSWSLKSSRANGPSNQYRTQAHLYGKGWVDDGFPVRLVMIAFLPREGELSDAFFWSEPYNPEIATKALERINHLETLRLSLGIEAALSLYPECEDRWCPWCGTQSSFQKKQPSTSLQFL